ncbi:hypothetical protein [Rhizobium sp. 18055]|uniref:hypothetical protein n=1 Tax=Rhizobium sp. 18055 TaxID=2681403 RepID=UPI0013595A9D|nr:hypothetical protein [Rhizobium sp. 18055]
MQPKVKITDFAIWFKHIEGSDLLGRLQTLKDDEEVSLEVDGVIGRWKRMKTGSDGRRTDGIRPHGSMKDVWNGWYKARRGDLLNVREVVVADDYLASVTKLFPEWQSPEDEEAFRDL